MSTFQHSLQEIMSRTVPSGPISHGSRQTPLTEVIARGQYQAQDHQQDVCQAITFPDSDQITAWTRVHHLSVCAIRG